MQFLPLILMFVVLYFLMIRPQMKRAKEHKALVEGIQKGDEIVSASGVVGRVTKVDAVYITVEISGGDKPVEVVMQRQAIQTLLPKGTFKDLLYAARTQAQARPSPGLPVNLGLRTCNEQSSLVAAGADGPGLGIWPALQPSQPVR